MSKSAKAEFIVGIQNIGIHKIDGAEKFIPQVATVNGVKGRIWTKRLFENGVWFFQGKRHVRSAASEIEVRAAFAFGD